jgi:ankyrin repeat domain-containing protein 50
MEVASSAVGIASLGIQVCQGLLSYYDSWQGYDQDISNTYNSAYDLSHILILLRASLENEELDQVKKDRVKHCIQSCDESLQKLSQKCEKLRKHGQPTRARQKAWAELRRGWYPFRASTLVKLQGIVADVRERLKLAVQVLQLEVGTSTQHLLRSVAADSRDTAGRTEAIQTQVQLIWDAQHTDQFKKVVGWLSPSDPETNHSAACQRHEPQTGAWLLQYGQYQKWKAGDIRHLWLYGKAGCGKTVLCSTVIEDIRAFCTSRTNVMHANFYFTFSDNQKQSYESLLRSLVAQLGWKEPALSMLLEACQKPNASISGFDGLERILLACVESYDELFVLLDALDECPEDGEVRQSMLEGLERIARQAPNVRMFVTSREVTEVRESMQILGAEPVSIVGQLVDADIQRYLSTQLLSDRKLCKLDTKTRRLVEEVISRKADGMYDA